MLDSPPSTSVNNLLRAGIEAVKAGQRDEGRDLLLQVIEQDEQNATAWFWLSSVMDDPDEQKICLENVLALEPTNHAAQERLDKLLGKTSPPVGVPDTPAVPMKTPAEPDRTHLSPRPSKYKRIKPGNSPKKQPKREATAGMRAASADKRDIFADKYACPYCATPTQESDNRCPKCTKSLWLYTRRKQEASKYFKFVFWLQIFVVLMQLLALAGSVLVLFVDFAAIEGVSAADAEAAQAGSLSTAALNLLMTIYAITVLVGLIQRWRVVYYLYILNAVLMFGAGVAIALFSAFAGVTGVLCGGFFFLLGAAQFFLVLNMGEDFTFDKHRLELDLDADAHTGSDLFKRGRKYAKDGMWAKAGIHFRKAAGQLPDNINVQIALAVAYLNLNHPHKAKEPLKLARQIAPDDERLEKIADDIKAELAKMQNSA